MKKFIYKLISFVSNKIRKSKSEERLATENNIDHVSELIYNQLSSDKSTMISRFGATELMCMVNYLGVKQGRPSIAKFLQGESLDWWWKPHALVQIKEWSGFFPATVKNVETFCELMIQNIPNVDILASWLENEIYFKEDLKNTKLIKGLFLDPFWSSKPWTRALKGKKVLVIHPFEKEIISQYKNRELLFKDQDVLPEFELHTIQAVQSLGGNDEYSSWFDAFDYMKSEIDKVDFDICLIGAGAYGYPLAAYVKSINKKAVHVGGSLQLLFGIKGKRWESPNYGVDELGETGKYPELMNEYWIYPGEESRPKNADSVEGACYW